MKLFLLLDSVLTLCKMVLVFQILTMLRTIQDSSPSLPPHLIDNIVAMLRTSELYNPGSTSLTEDPEAIGFMDGLMEVWFHYFIRTVYLITH